MAHSNESKVYEVPAIVTSNALSYVFPQDSQLFTVRLLQIRSGVRGGPQLAAVPPGT